MSLSLMMRHHALLAAAAKKGGGGLPDGYEAVDYLENIKSGYNCVWTYDRIESNVKYKHIRASDLIEAEADYTTTQTSYACDFKFIEYKCSNRSMATPAYCGAVNGYLFARYYSVRGGGDNDYNFTTRWDGNLTRLKSWSDTTNNRLKTLYKGVTQVSRYDLWTTDSEVDGHNGIENICICDSNMVGSRFRYYIRKDRTTGDYKVHFVAARRKSDGAPAIVELVSQDVYNANATFWRAGNDA